MSTDRGVIQEVRSRTDLAELVGQYVPLRKAGGRFVARCPFHEEKSPSFSVSPDVGLYFCFGCKASGDAIRFYEQMEGVTFPEALRALAEKAGVEVPETRDPERIAEDRRQRDVGERLMAVCEAAAVFYRESMESAPFSELARGALEERGVTAEMAERFRLGYAPAQWDALALHLRAKRFSPADGELAGLLLPGRGGYYDRFRHRLMFPVLDRGGRVVAFSGRILPVSEEIPEGVVPAETGKYVNSPETPIYHKGELLYGLANARTAMRHKAEAVVVEGNFDVVQMHQHGFAETVAPLGTSFTESQAKLLRRFAETVVLVFDGDEAGRKAARAAHAVCAKAGLMARVGVLPPKMDPDSYLRSLNPEHGQPGMANVLATGPSIVEWLIKDAGATCGDNIPERVAAVRSLAPVIAAVRDAIERDVYVRLTAKALYLEERAILSALREHQQDAARAARESPFGHDDARKRPLLTRPQPDEEVDPTTLARRQRAAMASGLEALLMQPELLGSTEAAELEALFGPTMLPVLHAARVQWAEAGRIDGALLMELCPERARSWLGARLIPGGGEDDPGLAERCPVTLADAVAELRRCEALGRTRALKQASARAGTQGDPGAELGALNEQLRVKRELARSRTTKGGGD
ncbi:MAG: DNA primase [Polyangiales bacterium]